MFDEPTLGLDAAARYKFYNLLLEDYEKNPRTVIISTHLIDEVTNLFEEVFIRLESIFNHFIILSLGLFAITTCYGLGYLLIRRVNIKYH